MAPNAQTSNAQETATVQHGVKGVYYGGKWLDMKVDDIEDFTKPKDCDNCVRQYTTPCPRSRSRNTASYTNEYDVLIIGAGCIGAAVARELSRYKLKVLWAEAADDVSQGATKGNSGIVHAGYDDKPGSLHAKFCWPGNQMFPQLDKELRFGYQLNGSLVLAFNQKEFEHLSELKKRGEANGVKRLQILNRDEVLKREPHVNDTVVGALYSPDAGNVIPYEYTIALAENAVDNGVELRIRREVTKIDGEQGSGFSVQMRHWEPKGYVDSVSKFKTSQLILTSILALIGIGAAYYALQEELASEIQTAMFATFYALALVFYNLPPEGEAFLPKISPTTPLSKLVEAASAPVGNGASGKVGVQDMFTGGSGSSKVVNGVTVATETVKARYVINCAGGASDKIAKMIGDDGFDIKPRLGDYLLLNRNQGYKAKHTLFPCPDPVLGKGVLVQTTLWGNLILGPTARDTYKKDMADMSVAQVQEYILSKCRKLVPSFDARETIHAFCGARAKSTRGDWIIEPSVKNGQFIHVAGIDSPGLAGSPAIAKEVIRLLQEAGLKTSPNPYFNPNRAPIIAPKDGLRGLKMGPVGKNDSDGIDEKAMASNVICKCEKVTELEVVRAMGRSLPIDSTQAIRKRTRAGMGHCQGDPCNYNCEARVKAIIARETRRPVDMVGGRPWPATSTLTQRWIDDKEKDVLNDRMMTDKIY
mmetsp:Transcript_26625/g.41333  ORF Transcript_26625/g.41333 Transcript_26625/m.41333 type:complete len:702 (-) Transcript_26625:161-2266(-)